MAKNMISDEESRELWILMFKKFAKPGKEMVLGELVDSMFSLIKNTVKSTESKQKELMQMASEYLTTEGVEALKKML